MPKKSEKPTVKAVPKVAVDDSESAAESAAPQNKPAESTSPKPKTKTEEEEKKPIVLEPSHFKEFDTWFPTIRPSDQKVFLNFKAKLEKKSWSERVNACLTVP